MESGLAFNFLIFASADQVIEFSPEKLAEMGVGTIWLGRESRFSDYPKNKNIDMKTLVEDLKRYGIKTILSSILLLDHHTKENIQEDIDEHLACKPTFSQFSHYAPIPGTPLWDRMHREGRLIPGIPWEEMHAFHEPWFYHPHFTSSEAQNIQETAYLRDFYELGPSWFRLIETEFEGWMHLHHSANPHLRTRAEFFAQQLKGHKTTLAAMDYLAPTARMRTLIKEVRQKMKSSFGPVNPLQIAVAGGLFLTGRFREFLNRYRGDVIQPTTRFAQYI